MSDASQWVLGVDGGGTKTVAWVAEAQPALPTQSCATASSEAVPRGGPHCLQASGGTQVIPLAQATSGPSNPQAVGWDTALANLDAAIDGALATLAALAALAASEPVVQQPTPSHSPRSPFAAAVLALAGSDRPENRRRLLEWADRRKLATRLALVHDGQAVLAAGSPDYTGIALIAGTGSLAFGRNCSGKTARAGGWGFLASDEGSGYWIALEGLRAAARSHDGLGDRTTLDKAFAAELGTDNFEAMIPRLYERADDRAAVASLARVVWNAAVADAGDAVAMRILLNAARHWNELIRCVAEKLGLMHAPFPLAIGGGVFAGNPAACNLLRKTVQNRPSSAGPPCVVEAPAAGAVELARRLLARPPGVHTL